jgi:hypothetical protein
MSIVVPMVCPDALVVESVLPTDRATPWWHRVFRASPRGDGR